MIQKHKRIRNQHYLEWLRSKPCFRCGRPANMSMSVVPAHQNLGYGIMGGKSHDVWAVPLCFYCHADEHSGHKSFWNGIDLIKIIDEHQREYIAKHPDMPFVLPEEQKF